MPHVELWAVPQEGSLPLAPEDPDTASFIVDVLLYLSQSLLNSWPVEPPGGQGLTLGCWPGFALIGEKWLALYGCGRQPLSPTMDRALQYNLQIPPVNASMPTANPPQTQPAPESVDADLDAQSEELDSSTASAGSWPFAVRTLGIAGSITCWTWDNSSHSGQACSGVSTLRQANLLLGTDAGTVCSTRICIDPDKLEVACIQVMLPNLSFCTADCMFPCLTPPHEVAQIIYCLLSCNTAPPTPARPS